MVKVLTVECGVCGEPFEKNRDNVRRAERAGRPHICSSACKSEHFSQLAAEKARNREAAPALDLSRVRRTRSGARVVWVRWGSDSEFPLEGEVALGGGAVVRHRWTPQGHWVPGGVANEFDLVEGSHE